MVALAIIALTAVVLLDRQSGVYHDAARARDVRVAWILASHKLGELELDKTLWQGDGGQSSGDFHELDLPNERPVYSKFTWEYLISKVQVETTDPNDVSGPPKKPKEIYRLGLKIDAAGLDEPMLLEAMFPIPDQSGGAPTTGDTPPTSGASGNPANPSSPGPSPGPLPGPVKK